LRSFANAAGQRGQRRKIVSLNDFETPCILRRLDSPTGNDLTRRKHYPCVHTVSFDAGRLIAPVILIGPHLRQARACLAKHYHNDATPNLTCQSETNSLVICGFDVRADHC
jgi:hypothetical protein